MKKRTITKLIIVLVGVIVVTAVAIRLISSGISGNNQGLGEQSGTTVELVVENQVLNLEILGFYEAADADGSYEWVTQTITANQEVAGYVLEAAQFAKAVQIEGPDANRDFIMVSAAPSHEAYIVALIGDIVALGEGDELTYQVANGHLEIYQQPVLLESDYNSIYIKSIDGTKEKMVDLDVYRQRVVDPATYMTMLNW